MSFRSSPRALLASTSRFCQSSLASPAAVAATSPFSEAQVEQARAIIEARRRRQVTVNEFEELGSTQTRSNTFQPHHSLHRPVPSTSLTLSTLVASGAHLGHALDKSHPASYSHIYGTRNGVAVIDVRHTLAALRTAAQVVKKTVMQDGIVLFLGSLNRGIDRAVEENAKRLGANGFGTLKWKPGSISNANKVFSQSAASLTTTEGEDGDEEKPSSLQLRPSLVIALSPTTTQHALREITAANIPTIGITDTNVDPRCVTYSIPANDDAPRTVELIAGVLACAGQDGLRLRGEHVQKHKKYLNQILG